MLSLEVELLFVIEIAIVSLDTYDMLLWSQPEAIEIYK